MRGVPLSLISSPVTHSCRASGRSNRKSPPSDANSPRKRGLLIPEITVFRNRTTIHLNGHILARAIYRVVENVGVIDDRDIAPGRIRADVAVTAATRILEGAVAGIRRACERVVKKHTPTAAVGDPSIAFAVAYTIVVILNHHSPGLAGIRRTVPVLESMNV